MSGNNQALLLPKKDKCVKMKGVKPVVQMSCGVVFGGLPVTGAVPCTFTTSSQTQKKKKPPNCGDTGVLSKNDTLNKKLRQPQISSDHRSGRENSTVRGLSSLFDVSR